jgi:arginase
MRVHVIRVPYDAGNRGVRMGAGPERLASAAKLRSPDADVTEATVEASTRFRAEIGTTFDLHRTLAREVRGALDAGRFPLVLSGNCGAVVGVVGGLGGQTALAWFDGHGDFNTPETTRSGFLDGMALAVATGRCFRGMAASVPGFVPVPEQEAFLVGARDIDPEERTAIEGSRLGWVTVAQIRKEGAAAALQPVLSRLRARRIHVHVDLDVHDPTLAPANEFAPKDGLAPHEVQEAVRAIGAALPISSASIGAYDPSVDPEGRALAAGVELIELFARLSEPAPS